jgi:hypothetical protein
VIECLWSKRRALPEFKPYHQSAPPKKKKKKKEKRKRGQALVAHACYPSYSGGRDQEDCGSKPVRQIVCKTLSQKKQNKTKK